VARRTVKPGTGVHGSFYSYRAVTAAVDDEITRLGIEHDKHGNRAKAFLYCLETTLPEDRVDGADGAVVGHLEVS
jgi:hypothetical protein